MTVDTRHNRVARLSREEHFIAMAERSYPSSGNEIFVTNEDLDISQDVRDVLEHQARVLLESEAALDELDQATTAASEEEQLEEELFEKIVTKVGIASELEALNRLYQSRADRHQQILDRYWQEKAR
jgi:hypothetical protein